jgi:RNA polymerase sigma factor (sigma-70 family)
MNLSPETRASLLIRVRDPADQTAWYEFVEIYWPVIIRLARRKGMQEHDADDVAQTVLLAVAKSIESREHDRQQSRFRTWLNRVAQNAILNALTRKKPDRGAGDSGLLAILEQHPAQDTWDSDLLRLEYRREVFRWAAKQIKCEFETATWEAFWLTTVDEQSCDQAARKLGKPVGSIYAARSRVMRRLQDKVAEYESGELP